MTYLFIADLHLSPDHPRLVRGFLDLLTHYQDKNTQLYILGDWFNAWIGDDYSAPWLDEMVVHLKAFTQAGNRVYFQVGNRDFALHQSFLNRFGGQLLHDQEIISINGLKLRIEHGDALCTDDISYQRFKKIIRNPLILFILSKTPLSFRMKLAGSFRKQSNQSKQMKAYNIMDVNQLAVEHALHNVDVIVHGHTHRPAIHNNHKKPRIVLGDWRESEGQILEITDQLDLKDWKLNTWTY